MSKIETNTTTEINDINDGVMAIQEMMFVSPIVQVIAAITSLVWTILLPVGVVTTILIVLLTSLFGRHGSHAVWETTYNQQQKFYSDMIACNREQGGVFNALVIASLYLSKFDIAITYRIGRLFAF